MPSPVRVATFNIRTSRARDGADRWRRRRDACLDAIAGLGADVVGLQEVRRDQVADLRERFPEAVVAGGGRGRFGGGERAPVLVSATGWSVESADTRWLSPTPAVRGSRGWDAKLPRIATLVRLRRGPAVLGVVATHLDHRGAVSRERGAAMIAQWVTAEADRPWVVLGDLNAPPGAPPLRILADAGFVDALPADSGGTEHAFTGATDRSRIDHVLVGPGIRVARAWVDHAHPHGRLPSDHWPVVADLLIG